MAFVFDDNYAYDILNYLGLGEDNPFLTPDSFYNDPMYKLEVENYINSNVDYDNLAVDEQQMIDLAAKQILAGRIATTKLPLILPQVMSDDSTSFRFSEIDFNALGEALINKGESIISSVTGVEADFPAFLLATPTDIITGE